MSSETAIGRFRQFELWIAAILFEVAIGTSVLFFPLPMAMTLSLILPLSLVVFSKPILGLSLIIPFFPNYPFVLFNIGEIRIHPIDPLLLITVMCWVIVCLKNRELRLEGGPVDIAVLLLFLWAMASLLWTPSIPRGAVQALKMIKGLSIYYLHVQMVRDKRDFDIVMSTWILTGVVFSAIGFRELLTHGLDAAAQLGGEYERLTREVRTTALFHQPNSLGFFLVLCIVIGIVKFSTTPSKSWKRFLLFAVPFMFLVLLSTFSRKSFLGFFIAAGYLSLQRRKVFFGFVALGVVVFVTLTILGSGGFIGVLIERFGTFFEAPEEAITERVTVWTSALEVFLSSPIFGRGLGSTVFLLRLQDLSLQTTHNMYLYVLAELGLIGFLLFFFVGVQLFKAFYRLAKTVTDESIGFISKGIIAGFLVIMAQGGFKALNLVDPILWGHLGLAAAFFKVHGGSYASSSWRRSTGIISARETGA